MFPLHKQTFWWYVAAGGWIILTLVVTLRAGFQPERRTVYPVYMRAATHWMENRPLYAGAIDFRYSPPVAAAFVPFRLLSPGMGAALWRLVNIAGLLAALIVWARATPLIRLHPDRYAWFFLLMLPLAANGINNGQINPLLTALLVAATAAVSFNLTLVASIALVLATLVKVYPIVLALLLALCFPRRMTPRLLLAAVVLLLLSLFTQAPAYVLDRYAEWLHAIRTDDRDLWSFDLAPTDVRLLLRLWWGVPPAFLYGALQAASGLFVAGLCLRMRLRNTPDSPLRWSAFAFRVLGLACCWMLLFGPATESNTFILAAPPAALLLTAPPPGRLGRAAWLLGLVGYLTLVASQILGWLPSGPVIQSTGIAPLGTLLLFAAFTLLALAPNAEPAPVAASPVPTPAQA